MIKEQLKSKIFALYAEYDRLQAELNARILLDPSMDEHIENLARLGSLDIAIAKLFKRKYFFSAEFVNADEHSVIDLINDRCVILNTSLWQTAANLKHKQHHYCCIHGLGIALKLLNDVLRLPT